MLTEWKYRLMGYFGTFLRKLARIIAPLWGQRFVDPKE
jgi:hypothetical protein